jgi:hypothetical protein
LLFAAVMLRHALLVTLLLAACGATTRPTDPDAQIADVDPDAEQGDPPPPPPPPPGTARHLGVGGGRVTDARFVLDVEITAGVPARPVTDGNVIVERASAITINPGVQ